MSILNVDKIQPIGGGSTITVDATDIQVSTGTIRASTFSGDVSATGIGVTSLNIAGVTTASGNIKLVDNVKATFGNSGDLEIYHDGSTNYIRSNNGAIVLRDDTIQLKAYSTTDTYVSCVNGGAVSLRYDNSVKLTTETSGVNITGICTATSFVGSGANLTNLPAQITFSNPSNNRILTSEGGIGVNAESKLTFDSTTTQLKLTRDDDSNSGLYVFHNDGNECARLVQKGTGHEGTLVLRDGGTAKVLLDGETGSNSYINSGKFGIGTQSPNYKTVIQVSDTTAYSASTISANQFQLAISNSGANGVAGILLATEPSSGNGGHCGIRALSTGNGNSDLTFSTRGSSTSGERLRITATGNVGIGSAIPSAKLDVVGGIKADGSVRIDNNASPTFYLTSTSTTGSGRIFFGDPDSDLVGRLSYIHDGDY